MLDPRLPPPPPPLHQPTIMEALKNRLTLQFVNWSSGLVTATITMLAAGCIPYLKEGLIQVKSHISWNLFNWALGLATIAIAMLTTTLIPYLCRLNSNINALNKASEDLQILNNDVSLKIEIFKLRGHVWPNEVNNWVEKVEQILKEATQLIDHHLRRKSSFTFDYVRISIVLPKLLARVQTLLKEGVFHNNSEGMKPPPVAVQEQKIDSSTFGLDSYIKEAAKILADDEENMLGIVGMGGIGKTTLLKRINNELRSGGSLSSCCSFDRVIWVVASKDCTPQNLSTKVAKALELQLSDENLPKLISNYMSKKNFLLLLDDVWEYLNLEQVGIPANQGGKQFKRKVILTTRIPKVCAEMKVKRKIKVDTLNKEDAWLLFKDKIPEDLMSDGGIRLAAEAIAEECKGLPLALNSIGRAMAAKSTTTEWREALKFIRKSKHLRVPDGQDETFNILMLSYDSLQDDTEKKCFLSCALWPEDWKIDVSKLILSWIGFGFLDCNSTNNYDSAYANGVFLVGRLRMAALLEHDTDDETKVWMHDVIRDMALWIANEKGHKPNKWMVTKFNEIDTHQLQGAQRLSLLIKEEGEAQTYPLHCSELLSLTIFSDNYKSLSIPQLVSPQKLQYLDLQCCNFVYNIEEIGFFENLLYLNLSYTSIEKLPNTMMNLKKLKFLLLRNTLYLIYIPFGIISNLSDLLVLDLYASNFVGWGIINQQERTSASIEEVLSLSNSLQYLGISVERFDDLLRLSKTYFTRSISLIGESDCSEDEKRKMVNLVSTRPPLSRNLKELKFKYFDSSLIFEEGWTLTQLETLTIVQVNEIIWQQVQPAGVALPSIRELYIMYCNELENITWVMQLPSLEHLKVDSCKVMNQVIAEDSVAGGLVIEENIVEEPFRCLKTLKLFGLRNLHSFCDGEYAFPSLKLLEIDDCDRLQKLPFGTEIIRNGQLKISMEDELWASIMSRVENVELKLYYQRAFQSL